MSNSDRRNYIHGSTRNRLMRNIMKILLVSKHALSCIFSLARLDARHRAVQARSRRRVKFSWCFLYFKTHSSQLYMYPNSLTLNHITLRLNYIILTRFPLKFRYKPRQTLGLHSQLQSAFVPCFTGPHISKCSL